MENVEPSFSYDDMTGVDPNETVHDVAEAMCGYADRMDAAVRESADRMDAGRKRRCDAVAALLRHYALRIDNARRRELEDVNWKDICAKCRDGEIEPKFCFYYGEPNGCNAPDTGYHPVSPRASAEELWTALDDIVRHSDEYTSCDVFRFGHTECDGMRSDGECPNKGRCDRIFSALRLLRATSGNAGGKGDGNGN